MPRPSFDARRSRTALAFLALLSLASAAPARAHFLWIAIDGSRQGRLTFGETPDEPTPADLVARLAEARAKDGAGQPLALHREESGWSGGAAGSKAVSATQDWGVVDRSGDGTGAFLLHYYAKGAAGLAETATDLELPFELFARQEGGEIVATLKRGAKGVAGSPVHVSLPSGRSLDRSSDASGEIRFPGEGGGLYGLRARVLEDGQGEAGGKKYGDTRHYSTLTFTLPGTAAAAAKPRKADPEAYALLKKAHDSRQVMPPDFDGFRAELTLQQGDRTLTGELVYRRKGETDVKLQGADAASLDWARAQLLNLVGHRRGGDFDQGDGKNPLELGPRDDNPYGRLIVLHDALESSYRVKDGKVTEVTRTAGGSRFTISVIDTIDADDGKYLANHFVVTYRDAATGALQKFEGYRDSYARVNGVWLPTGRTVIEVAGETSPLVRTLRIKRIVELDAEGAEAGKGEAPAPAPKPAG